MHSKRSATLLGVALTLSFSLAAAQQRGGERDILPQAQSGTSSKGQAHCPL